MHVAAVNDDGIRSRGLHALADALHSAGHKLDVVAPHKQRSGSGTSLGSELDGRTIPFTPVQLDGVSATAYAVEGTPALIALALANGLLGGKKPDVVVSGINSGHNVGRLTLFSGTLAVALVAAAYGVPGIALSCAAHDVARYPAAARFLAGALDTLVASMPPGVAYNINYPSCDPVDLRGVRTARLHTADRPDVVVDRSECELRVRLADRTSGDRETDIGLLDEGFISLTPIVAGLREYRDATFSLTDVDAIQL